MNHQHSDNLLFVGLDVHKDSTSVALAQSWGDREVRFLGDISSDLHAFEKLFVRLRKAHKVSASQLRVVYEAGPCGFGISRRCQQLKVPCTVVAPSLIPKRPGDKVKTNRRDAIKLARLHRADELTAVRVPDPDDEAIRDLCRARTDAVNDQRRSRARLKAFLLRNGYKYSGKSSWTPAHMSYLREIVLPHPAHKTVLEEYLIAVDQADAQVARLTGQIQAHSVTWQQNDLCRPLMALKGFQSLTATTLLSEIGDISRFDHPRKLMAFLGLVPGEYSSGNDVRKTGITKCGNHHARWFLVEAAQHYALAPKVSKELMKRQAGLPRRVIEISWTAQNRLYKRFQQLRARGKEKNKATTAVARELVGFLWAILREYQQPGAILRKQKPLPNPQPQPERKIRTYALSAKNSKRNPRARCVDVERRSRANPA